MNHTRDFEIGKAEVLFEGKDITILTYGILLKQALSAREILNEKGKSVGIVNLRTLKPIDEKLLSGICRDTSLIVTLEDHFITGGLFSILSEFLSKSEISCKILPIALENKWFKPAMLPDILKYEKFTGEDIASKIINEYSKNDQPAAHYAF